MTTPEAPRDPTPEHASTPVLYPFSPESRPVIAELTRAALQELEQNKEGNEDYWQTPPWLIARLGFGARLEVPVPTPTENTIHTLLYEDVGVGRHFGRPSIIKENIRRPNPRRGYHRNYGIITYTLEGVVREPEGEFPLLHAEKLFKKDVNNPQQRAEGFEALLEEILGYAPKGWGEQATLDPKLRSKYW